MMHYQDEITNGENQIGFDTTNGLYLVEPTDNELGDMLEKADLARRSIKGIKGNHYAIYTDDLQQERFREERIIRKYSMLWKSRQLKYAICRVFREIKRTL